MSSSPSPYAAPPISPPGDGFARGALMVLGAALAWSFGGVIARFLVVQDSWTVVFWRSTFAATFLLGFLVWRDGLAGTCRLFREMGWPGVAVGLCFTISSIGFVLALGYTTVANILLMQAGVPLIAALMGVLFLKEHVDGVTWAVEDGVPRLEGAPGWLACEVADFVEGGDHVLALGQVVAADRRAGPPLTYHGRVFGTHSVLETQN